MRYFNMHHELLAHSTLAFVLGMILGPISSCKGNSLPHALGSHPKQSGMLYKVFVLNIQSFPSYLVCMNGNFY